MNPSNEPALIAGGVGALLTVLVAFGVPITADQKVAIIGAVGPLYALGAAFLIRRAVTPNAKLPAPPANPS